MSRAARARFGPAVPIGTLALLLPTICLAGDDAGYVAVWVDGSRVSRPAIEDWDGEGKPPRLGDRQLFDPQQPVRWIGRVDEEPPAAAVPRVELIGGDVLPGRVVSYRRGGGRHDPLAGYVLVEPTVSLGLPDGPSVDGVRVDPAAIRRIVAGRSTVEPCPPGSVVLAGGRRLDVRTLRWSEEGLRILTTDGVETVALSQVVELRSRGRDPWEEHLDRLALLTPAPGSRWIRIRTREGMRLTTSTDRLRVLRQGGPRHDPNYWYQCVQPVWTDRPVWLRFRSIGVWCFYAPHEAPLSCLGPERVARRSVVGGSWRWRVDRDVRGGRLSSEGRLAGWGLGVQAGCDLEVTLPEIAMSLEVSVGLDDAAADGGCARVRIEDASGGVLYESPLLVGSVRRAASGRVSPPLVEGRGRPVRLVTDMAHADRPEGSDPFDIRDHIDWIEPLVELDAGRLRAELLDRSARLIAAWSGWTVECASGRRIELANVWDDSDRDHPRFRLAVATRPPLLRVSRTVGAELAGGRVRLAVSRPRSPFPAVRLRVEVDGRPVRELRLPEATSGRGPAPIEVALPDSPRSPARVSLVHVPQDAGEHVYWDSLSLVPPPTSDARGAD